MKMDKVTFLNLFSLYIKYYRETQNFWEKKKKITLEIWEDKYNIVNEYLIEIDRVNIKAIDFNVRFARTFLAWLLKKYSHNHAVRQIEKCKAVLNFGGREEYISSNPINFYKIKREPPKKPPYFTSSQVRDLEAYRSKSAIKMKTWMMLIIQLHTGYDYGDLKDLSRLHLKEYKGRKYLVKGRHKNGFETVVQLSALAEGILECNDYKIGLLSNTVYNREMKNIFKELEIDIYLSAKGIRKLFIMNKINNEGYSLEATSKMAGHKYIKTTQDFYAEININLIHEELERRNNYK